MAVAHGRLRALYSPSALDSAASRGARCAQTGKDFRCENSGGGRFISRAFAMAALTALSTQNRAARLLLAMIATVGIFYLHGTAAR